MQKRIGDLIKGLRERLNDLKEEVITKDFNDEFRREGELEQGNILTKIYGIYGHALKAVDGGDLKKGLRGFERVLSYYEYTFRFLSYESRMRVLYDLNKLFKEISIRYGIKEGFRLRRDGLIEFFRRRGEFGTEEGGHGLLRFFPPGACATDSNNSNKELDARKRELIGVNKKVFRKARLLLERGDWRRVEKMLEKMG